MSNQSDVLAVVVFDLFSKEKKKKQASREREREHVVQCVCSGWGREQAKVFPSRALV